MDAVEDLLEEFLEEFEGIDEIGEISEDTVDSFRDTV